jgi:hypothetical protein
MNHIEALKFRLEFLMSMIIPFLLNKDLCNPGDWIDSSNLLEVKFKVDKKYKRIILIKSNNYLTYQVDPIEKFDIVLYLINEYRIIRKKLK